MSPSCGQASDARWTVHGVGQGNGPGGQRRKPLQVFAAASYRPIYILLPLLLPPFPPLLFDGGRATLCVNAPHWRRRERARARQLLGTVAKVIHDAAPGGPAWRERQATGGGRCPQRGLRERVRVCVRRVVVVAAVQAMCTALSVIVRVSLWVVVMVGGIVVPLWSGRCFVGMRESRHLSLG